MNFMSKEEIDEAERTAQSACVFVINPCGDGSILAITRKDDYKNIGLPGGKIDTALGETAKDGAIRELLEETGILVEKDEIVPIECSIARKLLCVTYLSTGKILGKLLPSSKEGMPMWVHPHMLLKDTCTYKRYNIKIFSKLMKKNII